MSKVTVESVYTNHDYEPYAIKRHQVKEVLEILDPIYTLKTVFEKNEVLKTMVPTLFYSFKNKWLFHLTKTFQKIEFYNLTPLTIYFQSWILDSLFYNCTKFDLNKVIYYDKTRNIPSLDSTSKSGPHLRFGTVSIREIVNKVKSVNETYLVN